MSLYCKYVSNACYAHAYVCNGRYAYNDTTYNLIAYDFILRELVTHGKFSANFYKEGDFCEFVFASLHKKPLLKGSLL